MPTKNTKAIAKFIRDTIVYDARTKRDRAARSLAFWADVLTRRGVVSPDDPDMIRFNMAYDDFDRASEEYRHVCVEQRARFIQPEFEREVVGPTT